MKAFPGKNFYVYHLKIFSGNTAPGLPLIFPLERKLYPDQLVAIFQPVDINLLSGLSKNRVFRHPNLCRNSDLVPCREVIADHTRMQFR